MEINSEAKEHRKTSNEILSELFSAFNAEPPKATLEDTSDSKKSEKKHKKSKKSKKKHKSKKRKKDKGDDSSDSSSRKKIKTTKVEVPFEVLPLALDILLDGTNPPNGNADSQKYSPPVPVPKEVTINEPILQSPDFKSEERSKLPATDEIASIAFEEPILDSKVPEDKKKGKILIPSLKNSAVFQETMRAVEEKQKEEAEKKARFEEGEISDSSSDKPEDDDDDVDGELKSTSKSSSHKKRSSKKESSKDKKRHKRSRSRSHGHTSSRSSHYSQRYSKHSSREKSRHSSRERSGHRDTSSRRSSDRYKAHSSRDRQRSREGRSPTTTSKDGSKHYSKHSSSREKERRKTRSKSKSKSPDRGTGKEKIDKQKLLAIARKNALKLIDAGIVPGSDKHLKSGGKTVSELTEYCKKLSKRDADGGELSDILSGSSDEEDTAFHHPFQVRDRPNSIVMNIRNATALPVRSLQEKAAEQSKQLRLQFPVSSGTSHRLTATEWVPVEQKKEAPKAIMPPLPPPKPTPPLSMPPLPPMSLQLASQVDPVPSLTAVPPPLPATPPVFPVLQPKISEKRSGSGDKKSLDISAIVSKRLNAMRKLQENPNDRHAISDITRAQAEMQLWSEQRTELGAFTGSTGARMLSPAELSSGAQAWAKKDQLIAAMPVKSGMGMALLQKMGWKPGEGLGRNKEGTLEPLKLEVKTDKKGLVATDEAWRMKGRGGHQVGPPLPTVKTLDGKHPVSLLNEYCNKRRWNQPTFDLAFECGPDHKKNFLFKVIVNGKEYKPSVASANKKQAKAEAAAICLRALGLMTSDILKT